MMSSASSSSEFHRRSKILSELLQRCFSEDSDSELMNSLVMGEVLQISQRNDPKVDIDGDQESDGKMPLLGGLSSADIRRFNRAAVQTLDPEQEKRLLEEMEAILTSIAEVLHPEGSTPDDLETLPSEIQSLTEEITMYEGEVDVTRRRIAGLAKQLNEVHPLLEEKLLHALDVIPGTVHKQQTAEANLQAATIELGLMKLAYLRSRVSQAIYGVTASGETGSGSTMSEALERANAKLKADARRMDEEERELDRQLVAYEQTLALVDGSGGFSQVIEDWVRVRRGMDECRRDLRRLGWTGKSV